MRLISTHVGMHVRCVAKGVCLCVFVIHWLKFKSEFFTVASLHLLVIHIVGPRFCQPANVTAAAVTAKGSDVELVVFGQVDHDFAFLLNQSTYSRECSYKVASSINSVNKQRQQRKQQY